MTRGATAAGTAGASPEASIAAGVQDALGWGAVIAALAVVISLLVRRPAPADQQAAAV